MRMRMRMMMVSRRSDRMPSITARAHVLETFEAIVRLFAVQLKLELLVFLRVPRHPLLERPGGTIRALWCDPAKVFCCRRASAFAEGTPDREL